MREILIQEDFGHVLGTGSRFSSTHIQNVKSESKTHHPAKEKNKLDKKANEFKLKAEKLF